MSASRLFYLCSYCNTFYNNVGYERRDYLRNIRDRNAYIVGIYNNVSQAPILQEALPKPE